MPTWTTSVPSDPRGPAFPILRTPAFKPLTAVITSEDLVGTYTHFWKGRTMPCEHELCEACKAGIPYRWHAYVSAWTQATGLHFIFESTAQAAETLTDYRDAFGTLRGCVFFAQRMNQKANGRVLIKTKPLDLKTNSIPDPPDLIRCLSIIWNLPPDDLDGGGFNPDKKSPHVKPK